MIRSLTLAAVVTCLGCSAGGNGGNGGGSSGGGGAGSGGSGGATGGGTATGGGVAGSGGNAGGGSSTAGGNGGASGGATAGSAGGGSAGSGGSGGAAGIPPVRPATQPAVLRGETYRGTVERFNRYYTEPTWTPMSTVYVSPTGTGNGASAQTPSSVTAALTAPQPGTRIVFLRGTYNACYQLDDTQSGTYDRPIVLYAERNTDGTRGVRINCCATGRQTCINLEGANYIAVDGFELVGGRYGVRAVGLDYPAASHQRGVAVLNNDGHDQSNDPFLTGASDWYVTEKNLAHGAGTGDGHGIYLSNGSDYNIARLNELWANATSDFQINADPASTCMDVAVPYTDSRCDGDAASGLGQGASDYMLIEGNFFHHGAGSGANFTSVRRSVVRNNIFGLYPRHGVSFWQETPNPNLGSSDNLVLHNLFITTQSNRHALQFIESSTRNRVENNLLVAVTITGSAVAANPSGLLLEVDGTVGANTYVANTYLSGTVSGRTPNAQEQVQTTFSTSWFAAFPTALSNQPSGFTPTATAPFLNRGALLPEAGLDMSGRSRTAPVDIGPLEAP